MKEPKLTIALAGRNGQATLVMSRNDNNRLNLVQWPMYRFEPDGYHALCQYLGDTTLRMLAVVHQDEFAKYPRLVPPKLDTDSSYGLVDALIQRSYKEKTTAYIAAIDRLIKHSADELKESNITETWQAVRSNLIEAFPA